MSYQKPQVLAENQTDGLYMMPCMVRTNVPSCKPWFLLKNNLCSVNNILFIITAY